MSVDNPCINRFGERLNDYRYAVRFSVKVGLDARRFSADRAEGVHARLQSRDLGLRLFRLPSCSIGDEIVEASVAINGAVL